jgi:hypothetical protein
MAWWLLLTRHYVFEGARISLTRSRCSKKTESDDKKAAADSKPDTAAAKKVAEGEKA